MDGRPLGAVGTNRQDPCLLSAGTPRRGRSDGGVVPPATGVVTRREGRTVDRGERDRWAITGPRERGPTPSSRGPDERTGSLPWGAASLLLSLSVWVWRPGGRGGVWQRGTQVVCSQRSHRAPDRRHAGTLRCRDAPGRGGRVALRLCSRRPPCGRRPPPVRSVPPSRSRGSRPRRRSIHAGANT
jgi:hypothetical protein